MQIYSPTILRDSMDYNFALPELKSFFIHFQFTILFCDALAGS